MKENPFVIKGYRSPDYFCDRVQETETLIRNIENGADSTLISPRKFGKTGLIYHTFYEIEKRNLPFITIYADIFATLSLDDFVKILAEAILSKFPEKTTLGAKFVALLKGFRPIFSYDAFSGTPQISFRFDTAEEKEHTLKSLFEFLNSQKLPVVLAIDEFQQITEYPEKNVEALLRTYAQQMNNIRFIYCGSKRKTMSMMFSDPNRPFFSSTRTLTLDKIDMETYANFIREKFAAGNMEIEDVALHFILEWTKRHTFYTQSLCNEVFALGKKKINLDIVRSAAVEILARDTSNFLQYRELLSPQQWRILIAIAKEDSVTKLTATDFLSKYKIGSATNARRAVEALSEKELVLENIGLQEKSYSIYNVFFSRWLALNY